MHDTDMSSYFLEDIDMQNTLHQSAVPTVSVAPETPHQNPFQIRQQRRVTFANQDSDDFQTSSYGIKIMQHGRMQSFNQFSENGEVRF